MSDGDDERGARRIFRGSKVRKGVWERPGGDGGRDRARKAPACLRDE